MKAFGNKQGFTLVEVLLAVTVFSILMTGLYTAMSTAAFIWRDSETQTLYYQRGRVAAAVLATELRGSYVPSVVNRINKPSAPSFFEGSGESISFIKREMYSADAPDVLVAAQVTIYVNGDELVKKIRKIKAFSGGAAPMPIFVDAEEKEYVILEDIEDLSFQYEWANGTKSGECSSTMGPPAAVLVKFTPASLNKSERESVPVFETAVPIIGGSR